MTPTLTILHRVDNTERIAFECDHARTLADHVGETGASLRVSAKLVLDRRAATCRCKPTVVEDLWSSMAYMREALERDLAADVPNDPAVLTLAHSHLEAARRWGCRCDPHVGVTAQAGVVEFHAFHREGCDRRKGGRSVRWLDLSPAVSA